MSKQTSTYGTVSRVNKKKVNISKDLIPCLIETGLDKLERESNFAYKQFVLAFIMARSAGVISIGRIAATLYLSHYFLNNRVGRTGRF
jgi:hypothetical protein